MQNIKPIITLNIGLCLFLTCSCSKIYDKQKQLKTDISIIETFINSHSLTPNGDIVKNDIAPQFSIALKDTIKVRSNVYYIILKQGEGKTINSSELELMSYQGFALGSNTSFESTDNFPNGPPQLVNLKYAIDGIKLGMTNFKNALVLEDGNLQNPGQGYLIFPSTLGYLSDSYKSLQPNSCLLFKVIAYQNQAL